MNRLEMTLVRVAEFCIEELALHRYLLRGINNNPDLLPDYELVLDEYTYAVWPVVSNTWLDLSKIQQAWKNTYQGTFD